jgi:hypothetical protein
MIQSDRCSRRGAEARQQLRPREGTWLPALAATIQWRRTVLDSAFRETTLEQAMRTHAVAAPDERAELRPLLGP